MKASMLGLMAATAAFGASSVYLWRQVDEQRARADAAEQAMRNLNTRIGQQQPGHAPSMPRHSDIDPGFASGGVPAPHMPPPSAAITPEKEKGDEAPPERGPWMSVQRHEPPAAMKRLMCANRRNVAESMSRRTRAVSGTSTPGGIRTRPLAACHRPISGMS
jgi:hypothetical protein